MFDAIDRDLCYALRALRRSPGFTTVALVVLALGLGATTVMFVLIDGALLRSRPYPSAERLFHIQTLLVQEGSTRKVSYPDFEDLRSESQAVEDVVLAGPIRLVLTEPSAPPESLAGEYVSSGYFELFGVRPLLGRTFVEEETSPTAGVQRILLISEGLWRRRFGADPAVVGRQVATGEGSFEIIGVVPAPFGGLTDEVCLLCQDMDFWIPAPSSALEYPGMLQNRSRRWHYVIGRLASGTSLPSAETEMEGIAARLRQAYPESNRGVGVRLTPVSETWREELRPGLYALFAGSVFLLLIGAVNIANLFVARGVARQKEMAIRVSLGASRSQLFRQLLMETLLLSVGGAALGSLVASWFSESLAVLGGLSLPGTVRFELGVAVFLFTVVSATAVGATLAVVPTFAAWKTDILTTLRRVSSGLSGLSAGRLLVVAQVALVLMLLANALLLIRSYQLLEATDTGFDDEHLIVAEINPNSPRYDEPSAQRAFLRELSRRLEALPGGDGITVAAPNLPPRTFVRLDVAPEGRELDTPSGTLRVETHRVFPNFFRVLGVPLIEGRMFDETERETTELDAILSASLAKRLWPGESAVGRRLAEETGRLAPDGMRVIGVVGDVKYEGQHSNRAGETDLYLSLRQTPSTYMTIAARTSGDATATLSRIRAELAEIDPELPILAVSTVQERFANQNRDSRLRAIVLGSFAGAAYLLASIGIYGTMRFSVSQSTREFGIRLALGSAPSRITRRVLAQGFELVAYGVLAGGVFAVASARALSSLLYGVRAWDAGSFAGAIVLLFGAAALACYFPARRASRVEPVEALRAE